MPEQAQHAEAGKQGRQRYWRRRVVIAGLLMLAFVVGLRVASPTRDERLAAIDAKRAVADEDNAALIYAELLHGEAVAISDMHRALLSTLKYALDPVSLLESGMNGRKFIELALPEGLLDPNDDKFTLRNSWRSADYPELRQWLDTHQERIDRLLAAAQKPACYFPLLPEPNRMGLFDVPTGAFWQCVCLLRRDANNDMAEGRIAVGLAKYRAMVSMGRHFEAQPSATHVSNGMACEIVALRHLITLVVTGSTTEIELNALTVDGSHLVDRWKSVRRDISRVRSVFAPGLEDRRRRSFRLYQWYREARYGDEGWHEDIHSQSYHRLLCNRRAVNILIELRRFKNRTGHWPDQLDEIAPSLDPQILIDPQNGGVSVYQRTEEGFRLYSTGPNGKDENGHHAWNGPDDWPIWPPRGPASQRNPAKADE